MISLDRVERKIHWIRDEKVLLDADLAVMYGVTTKRLNQAVKRNLGRFPQDFIFPLTAVEADNLRSQFATSKKRGAAKATTVFERDTRSKVVRAGYSTPYEN